jgi:choline dehydrogenase-like flavoprotein
MTTKLRSADIVIVGLGWTGGILAKELADTGLSIVVLERARRATRIRISCIRPCTMSCATRSATN